jgi:hypothetical protein
VLCTLRRNELVLYRSAEHSPHCQNNRDRGRQARNPVAV